MFPRQIQLWMYAAELGEAEAQYRLGRAYDRGEGVAKNHPLAIQWYGRAATQGHAHAAHNLAQLLYKGPKDYPAALKWMTCSAKQGDARGQYGLACFHLRGVGTPADVNAALDWYAKAAAQGDLDAMLGLGLLLCANLQRCREYQSGMDWLWRAADAGQPQALYVLGMIYLKGHGVVRDEKTAMELLARAVENGNEAALLVVKVQIGSARPGVLSPAERTAWWQHAAGCGFRHAAFELGLAYRHGDCGVCDPEQAAMWLETAAQQGHPKAQFLLGKLYHAGEGVLRSRSSALHWWHRSAEQKFYLALLVLGNSHWETGDGPAALAAYEKYAVLRPDEPHGWYGMGLVYQRRRQFAEAIAAFRKAITWEVEHRQAWENLAECLHETFEPKEAAAARREAMRIGKAQKAA